MVGVALHVYVRVRVAAMVDTCDLFRRLSRGAKYSKTAVSSMSVFQVNNTNSVILGVVLKFIFAFVFF